MKWSFRVVKTEIWEEKPMTWSSGLVNACYMCGIMNRNSLQRRKSQIKTIPSFDREILRENPEKRGILESRRVVGSRSRAMVHDEYAGHESDGDCRGMESASRDPCCFDNIQT